MLKLQDISFWIGRIDKRYLACHRNVYGDGLAYHSTASCDHRIFGTFHIVNCKGDVGESRPVDGGFLPFLLIVVLEYL